MRTRVGSMPTAFPAALIAALIALTASGCGKGDSPAPTSPEPAPAPPACNLTGWWSFEETVIDPDGAEYTDTFQMTIEQKGARVRFVSDTPLEGDLVGLDLTVSGNFGSPPGSPYVWEMVLEMRLVAGADGGTLAGDFTANIEESSGAYTILGRLSGVRLSLLTR